MKKLILSLLIGIGISPLWAQQNAQYTQFMSNKLAQNPAYAGSQDHLCFTALYRTQWVGLDGAPNTQTVSAHMPIFHNRVGIGLTLLRDDITVTKHHSVGMSYSYRIELERGNFLSIGLQGTLKSLRVDWQDLKAFDVGDEGIPVAESRSRILSNIGTGVYYNSKKFYLGLSIHNLIKPKLDLQNSNWVDVIPKDERHFFLMGGLVKEVSENVKVLPSFLVKYVKNAPMDIDFNTSFIFYDKFWAGLSYRWGDSIDAIFQYQITRQVRVGIAYDFTLTELRQVNQGSYEVLIQYCVDHSPKRLTNPRFF